MITKYEATALVKCQFQGILYPPGRKYSGFVKPPDKLFRIDKAEDMSEEALEAARTAELEAAEQAHVPSDPTPRDREKEAEQKKKGSKKQPKSDEGK